MKNVKKGLRLLVLTLLLVLAVCGVPVFGNYLNTNREQYRDREIRTEQLHKKEDEEEEDKSKE